ncbi:MAG TPA: bifunctional diaminohydroxyphosphoribosylaminopyrimidine deaminase/5-amino-6-(5-phosphoribosylamino)uracil reductase RibD [Planctomycetes bacterium]|nr:bifunctional diaminohydroxyphosphoribosylaminopyrimidine deaminase/5-amino-6-(5-phosphoribosylamino)uracil reductase RibD [Planctomycetota bacterium]
MERQGTSSDSLSSRDLALLEKANAEALKTSWLMTAPNPRVGALALKNGHVVGRGAHEFLGGMHAEESALRDAGAWPRDSSKPLGGYVDEMVVTLEPCSAESESKRRAPCVKALLAAGVQRVLVGAIDVNPQHRGRGLDALRERGVKVDISSEPLPFLVSNAAFSRSVDNLDRPWVLLKWAATLDGKVAAPIGGPKWISGEESRKEVHRIRALSDAVLVGKGTLEIDNPQLDARPSGGMCESQPLRVFLGGGASVGSSAAVFSRPGLRLWVLGAEESPSDALEAGMDSGEDCVIKVEKGHHGLDIRALLECLRKDFSVKRLLVEGGPTTHGTFLSEGLVDAVLLYRAPKVFGGGLAACQMDELSAVELDASSVERRILGEDSREAFQVRTIN